MSSTSQDRSTPDVDAMLDWLSSKSALTAAAAYLCRHGFGDDHLLVDDVISESCLNILKQHARRPLIATNPEAYANRVLRNTVSALTRPDYGIVSFDDPVVSGAAAFNDSGLVGGATAFDGTDLGGGSNGDAGDDPGEGMTDRLGDEIRLLVDVNSEKAWLTSALLSYVTFLCHPTSVPSDAPAPIAGARPDQARVWPALWMAGLRDLFPDECPGAVRRRRARLISQVLAALEDVFAEYRLRRYRGREGQEWSDG